jgi:tRNA threonylcarbamoyl adenosine modification protein (Sua5/YciO/YrdC/YwlC family)
MFDTYIFAIARCFFYIPLHIHNNKGIMLVKIYPENPNYKRMAEVVRVLREGGLVIYPTDTVYAVGCDALNVRAVEKICQMKGIDPRKSNLSIICCDLSNISEYAKVSNAVFKLMKKNLPGAFKFLLPTSNQLPKIYKNRREVGIRIPDHTIVRELAKGLGNPILTMSIHEEDDIIEYSTDPELIEEKYWDKIDIIIDGGYGGYEPSTVVDCTTDDFEIVRQGKGVLIY